MKSLVVWGLVLVAMLASPVIYADNVGVAYNEETSRVTYQNLNRSDWYKFYINADVVQPDTSNVTTATRMVGHVGNEVVHVAGMGTFAKGYNATMVGLGVDLLDKQLLGVDVGMRNDGDKGLFAYWGVGRWGFSSDGFVDTNGKTYLARGNLLYGVAKKLRVGYEAEARGTDVMHSLRIKVDM